MFLFSAGIKAPLILRLLDTAAAAAAAAAEKYPPALQCIHP